MILSKYFKSVTYQWLRRRRVVSPQLGSARTLDLPQPASIWFAKRWSGCEPEHSEVFGHSNCPCVVIGDRSFVLNRKYEVLCFVGVAKFCFREWGSFVLNRNWRPGGVRPQGGWLGAPTRPHCKGRGLGSTFSQIHHPLAAREMQNVVCAHRSCSATGSALRAGAATATAKSKAKGTYLKLDATDSRPRGRIRFSANDIAVALACPPMLPILKVRHILKDLLHLR
jgi:hypothetical protein